LAAYETFSDAAAFGTARALAVRMTLKKKRKSSKKGTMAKRKGTMT
jgi:hypothetical protein